MGGRGGEGGGDESLTFHEEACGVSELAVGVAHGVIVVMGGGVGGGEAGAEAEDCREDGLDDLHDCHCLLTQQTAEGETPQLADINEGTVVYRKMALSMKLRWAVMRSSRLWI